MIKTQVLLAVHVLADETFVMWGLQFKIGGRLPGGGQPFYYLGAEYRARAVPVAEK